MRSIHVRIALALIGASACQSKPSKPQVQPSVAAAKPTPAGPLATQVELEVRMAYGPRRALEFQHVFLDSPDVQNCLKIELADAQGRLVLGLSGRVSYTGEFEPLVVETPSGLLKKCMNPILARLKMGRGNHGPFKLQISPVGTDGGDGLGVVLDLTPVKKYE